MKKLLIALVVLTLGTVTVQTNVAQAYNFGDFRSETLATKAWDALSNDDFQGVMAYTNKCLDLYTKQAKKMQASLNSYPEGPNEKIFSYWALNDIATVLFIQGEAFRKKEMKDEALAAYQRVVDEVAFGQTWDTKGWFWKPAEAAIEKIAALNSGINIDFGDYTSSHLTTQAWSALGESNHELVEMYVDKVIDLYSEEAVNMQKSLTEYPWESNDKIFSYWALNDVGTSLYILGESHKRTGNSQDALSTMQTLVDDYFYAQCWDPKGWFWKPAEAAQNTLDELTEI